MLGDDGLAEDATQQTFVQAWRHAADVDAARDPGPWLATIARRVAIDIVRREGRRPTTTLPDDPASVGVAILPPDAEALWRVWRVREAIDGLEPREREVVQLQHAGGLTHQEIAAQLGIAVGTVKSRSFRAHRALAAMLADERSVDVAIFALQQIPGPAADFALIQALSLPKVSAATRTAIIAALGERRRAAPALPDVCRDLRAG